MRLTSVDTPSENRRPVSWGLTITVECLCALMVTPSMAESTLMTLTMEIAQLAPLQFGGGGFLWWAVVFFVLAIVAAALGATGVAGVTMTVAKWFVIIFLILALISLLL